MLLGNATEEALRLVNSIDQSNGDDANVHALKAAILFKLKDNDGATREARAALQIDPENIEALKVLAVNRLANNDPKGALQLFSDNSRAQARDIGVQLIKINSYEQLGDLTQVEMLLRALTELYPKEVLFRKQLIKFYLDQHRPADAEKELRTIVAADQKNSEAELELVHLIYATSGPAAARAELVGRISAGGAVFPYQMALAELEFAQGDFADSFKSLETLADSASAPQMHSPRGSSWPNSICNEKTLMPQTPSSQTFYAVIGEIPAVYGFGL